MNSSDTPNNPPRKSVLVIGCGSELRGDDAVGRVAVDRVALELPECETLSVIGLLPEHAERIAEASLVILIDAAVGLSPGEVKCERYLPTDTEATSHGLGLARVLALSRDVFKAEPPTFCIRIGTRQFEPGAPLSADVRGVLPSVLSHVRACIARAYELA